MALCCGRRCLRISSIVLGVFALIFFVVAIYFWHASVQARDDAREEHKRRQKAGIDPEPHYISEFNNAVTRWRALGPESPVKQWLPGEMRVRTHVNDTASSPTEVRSLSDTRSVKMNMCDFIVGRQKEPCYAGTSPPRFTPLSYTAWPITTSAEDSPLPMPDATRFPPYLSLSLTLNDPSAVSSAADEESARTSWNFSVTTNASKDVLFSAWCTKTSYCTVAYLNSWCLSKYGPHAYFVGSECSPNDRCGDCVVKSAVEEACFVVEPRSRELAKKSALGEGDGPLLPEGVRGCFGGSFIRPGYGERPDNTVESAFKYHMYTVGDGNTTIPFKITVRRSDDPSLVLQRVLSSGKSFPLWMQGESIPPGFVEDLFCIFSLLLGAIFTFASAITVCIKNSRNPLMLTPSHRWRNHRRSSTARTKNT